MQHSSHSQQRSTPFLAILALLAAPALLPATAQAETAQYSLSKQYSTVHFRVLQEQYLYLLGRFNEFDGTLQFDPENLETARLSATVGMTSLDMDDSDVVELLTSSSVWFNTSLYREASFETEEAIVTGDNSVDFHGQLTFVGVTQPWILSATFMGGPDGSLEGDTVGMTARGSFNRADFGLDQYTNVADETVEIEVNVKFEQD